MPIKMATRPMDTGGRCVAIAQMTCRPCAPIGHRRRRANGKQVPRTGTSRCTLPGSSNKSCNPAATARATANAPSSSRGSRLSSRFHIRATGFVTTCTLGSSARRLHRPPEAAPVHLEDDAPTGSSLVRSRVHLRGGRTSAQCVRRLSTMIQTQPIRSSRPAAMPNNLGTFGGFRLMTAAMLTLGAAFIHLAVAPAHLREYLPFGVFFLAVGCAQIVLAVEVVSRPTRRLALAMAIGSAALVALWYVSRTVGLPIGPTPGLAEDTGLTDVICKLMEALSAILFLSLAAWPAQRKVRRMWLQALAMLPSAVLAAAMTSAAVAATLSAMPEAFNAAPAITGQPSTSLTTLVETPGPEPVDAFTLTAREAQVDGQTIWTYGGTVLGPELRVTQGHR